LKKRYGDQIAFDNREGAGHGSGISAGSQVSVDFVSITSNVPEAGMTLVYVTCGLIGLAAIRRKAAFA
jgi:hypothetical protein